MIAVIPIKCHSQRVPGKNLRVLGGEPLLCGILRTVLLAEKNFQEVWVDTDCDEISSAVASLFPTVRVHRRLPPALGTETSMNVVLRSFLSIVDATDVFQTHATNPFLDVETIDGAVQSFYDARRSGFDSVFASRTIQARFWRAGMEAVNHEPGHLIPTQDLSPLLLETSTFYIFPAKMLVEFGTRLGDNPRPYEVSEKVGFDIDTEEDFRLAETIWKGLRA